MSAKNFLLSMQLDPEQVIKSEEVRYREGGGKTIRGLDIPLAEIMEEYADWRESQKVKEAE